MSKYSGKSYWILTTELSAIGGGGIGTYVSQWVNVLQHVMEVTVFHLNPELSHVKESRIHNVRVVQFPADAGGFRHCLGYETAVAHSFDRVVGDYLTKEGPPYCIEAQDYQGIAYFMLLKKALAYDVYRDIKFVVQCHGPTFLLNQYNHNSRFRLPHYWIGEMEKFCLRAADICISPSHYLKDQLFQYESCLQRHYHIVRNPYQLRGIDKSEKKLPVADYALIIAKLSPLKGISQLFEALNGLEPHEFPWVIKIAGDRNFFYHAAGETMESYLRKKYPNLFQSGRIELLGLLKPEELEAIQQQAAFVLVPSVFDSFPYSVIEAMVNQVPVMVSTSGGHAEIVEHGTTGLLVDVTNLKAFQKELRYLCNIPLADREAMGQAARRDISKYCDPDWVLQQKLEILDHAGTEHGEASKGFPFLRVRSVFTNEKSAYSLSVVIPYYEMGDYLSDALDSLLAAELPPTEIIIVDDGSQKKPARLFIGKYSNDQRIRIIHQSNQGLPHARNNGAKEARCDYLAFLDPDDKVASEYYRKAVEVLDRCSNVHFVGCWTRYFGNSAAIWPAFVPEPPYLLFHNMVNSSSLVFRRSSFLLAGLNDPDMRFGLEDYSAVISMVQNGFGGIAIPEVLFEYRVRAKSMARGFNRSNLLYSYELIAERHRTIFQEYGRELAGLNLANGPGYAIDNPTLDYHLFGGHGKMQKVAQIIKRNKALKKISLKVYTRLKKIK